MARQESRRYDRVAPNTPRRPAQRPPTLVHSLTHDTFSLHLIPNLSPSTLCASVAFGRFMVFSGPDRFTGPFSFSFYFLSLATKQHSTSLPRYPFRTRQGTGICKQASTHASDYGLIQHHNNEIDWIDRLHSPCSCAHVVVKFGSDATNASV
jgi:hypothetical protein